jgi:Spy/CpxP family protein refolding chaperone
MTDPRRLGGVLLMVLLASALAHANQHRVKWWHSDRVKAEVGLTDEQSNELEAIFQATLPRMRADKEELDRQEQALSQLMTEATMAEADLGAAIDRVEAARTRASKTRTLMLYRMYRVMTPEQRLKLKALHESSKGKRGTGSDHRSN